MKILIAIDDSPCSTYALENIAQRPWSKDTKFQIIMVVEPLLYDYEYALSSKLTAVLSQAKNEFRDYSQELIKNKVSQFKQICGNVNVTGKILDGLVTDSILEEAKSWDADIIVVGSHGRKGVQKLVLGSVAENIASHAPCSVEIIKEKRKNTEK